MHIINAFKVYPIDLPEISIDAPLIDVVINHARLISVRIRIVVKPSGKKPLYTLAKRIALRMFTQILFPVLVLIRKHEPHEHVTFLIIRQVPIILYLQHLDPDCKIRIHFVSVPLFRQIIDQNIIHALRPCTPGSADSYSCYAYCDYACVLRGSENTSCEFFRFASKTAHSLPA